MCATVAKLAQIEATSASKTCVFEKYSRGQLSSAELELDILKSRAVDVGSA